MTSGPAFVSSIYGSDTLGTNPHALLQSDSTNYTYDPRGNLVQKTNSGSSSLYEYNVKNEMASYTDAGGKTSYEYDSTGRRILKKGANSTTQYVNQFLEIEK